MQKRHYSKASGRALSSIQRMSTTKAEKRKRAKTKVKHFEMRQHMQRASFRR